MLPTFCLVTGVLVLAQSADRPERLVSSHLSRGQELVYRGTCTEEALGKGVQLQRSYRLETRAFILDTAPQTTEIALLTVLKLRMARPDHSEETVTSSVRLEPAWIDLQGRLTARPSEALTVPLEGPATLEGGFCLELPQGRAPLANQEWNAAEAGRPGWHWHVGGDEIVNGASCLKLLGVQQSEDWDQPRADCTAWRRRDTIWLSPRLGLAYRVERILERREPAHVEPTQRIVTRYELESTLQYPGRLFEDRRREIQQARALAEAVAPLLPEPNRHGAQPFDAILAKIAYHLDNQPPTPYREAIFQVKRRVEAALRGETPVTIAPPATTLTRVAMPGQPAPDFTVLDVLTRQPLELRRWRGRAVLLVFYNPSSYSADEMLRYAQQQGEDHASRLQVLALAVTEDVPRIRQQKNALHLSFPILAGESLRRSYTLDATPKLIVLDAEGVVRGSFIGWGRETPSTISEELQRWLPKQGATRPSAVVNEAFTPWKPR